MYVKIFKTFIESIECLLEIIAMRTPFLFSSLRASVTPGYMLVDVRR